MASSIPGVTVDTIEMLQALKELGELKVSLSVGKFGWVAQNDQGCCRAADFDSAIKDLYEISTRSVKTVLTSDGSKRRRSGSA